MTQRYFPLVKGATTSKSPDVSTVMNQMDRGIFHIPEYQRDSEQWNIPKRSLFIESLINNMTIPPLIVYPEDDQETLREVNQIIDGQQRLTTIRDFVSNGFALAKESEVDYADNLSALIQGKTFGQLAVEIQNQIEGYVLNLIVLPKNLSLDLRLEIFRRINEGGVPLSPQDLRLAIFGNCELVYFIRLAGIFDVERQGSTRMIAAGVEKYSLTFPWKNPEAWKSWWHGAVQAIGQAPSQMFLYYVIAQDLMAVDLLLDSEKTQEGLKLKYDKTTVTVLDLYCAQAQSQTEPNSAQIVAGLAQLKAWFETFELWFNCIKIEKLPRVPLNSSTKVAFFIASASQHWKSPTEVTEEQWQQIQLFLTKGPSEINEMLGMDFSPTRGKWPGQKKQIEQTRAICQKIAST